MATVAQIAVYLLAVALPLGIFAAIVIGFGWKAAVLTLITPILALIVFGLVRAPQ